MTTMNTDERKERLKQIRERREAYTRLPVRYEYPDLPNWGDIDFLFSLYDSQAALPPGEWCRCLRQKGHENRTIECLDSQQVSRIAATLMRAKCVEKVNEIAKSWLSSHAAKGALHEVVAALESLTLDQVEQEKQ